jgi:CBS-domain-containing membrane protein
VSDIVIWHEHQGLTADAIVSQIPGLTLADVHAALAYYYENLDAVREEMRAELAAVDQYEANSKSILQARRTHIKRVS